jgi:alkanesulfonate monooxygenase SsuD/methylene tetrahydromethanopterin reductase-like flavin-dependent oxidoreductase (luciferase family)
MGTGLDFFTDFPFTELSLQRLFVADAERAGYSGVWATENRHDPFLTLAACAHRGLRLTVGTGVIAILAHNPFTVAQMAWDLHFSTGEKFILGIGAHNDVHLVHRLGVSAAEKHDRLIEAVRTIREIWASWQEDRDPDFRGKYYAIRICPPGYRPITRLMTLPKIFLLCSDVEDLRCGAEVDGIFTHPTWIPGYLEKIALPMLRSASQAAGDAISSRQFKIISGAVLATGAGAEALEESRYWARRRIADYWRQRKYDPVYTALGVTEAIERLRRCEAEEIRWDEAQVDSLYHAFVCEAPFGQLADRLHHWIGSRFTGIFPNIMSVMPRILPAELVADIRRSSPAQFESTLAP